MPEDRYTKEQEEALGQLMADYIGGHWQSSEADGCIIIYVKMNPVDLPRRFEIDRAGTVISG